MHEKQFYSKLKIIKKINSRLINRGDLKLIRRFLLNCEEENSKVLKGFKELARRNNFKIVNMGADSNVVFTLVASSLARKIQVYRSVYVSVIT